MAYDEVALYLLYNFKSIFRFRGVALLLRQSMNYFYLLPFDAFQIQIVIKIEPQPSDDVFKCQQTSHKSSSSNAVKLRNSKYVNKLPNNLMFSLDRFI